MNEAVTPPMFPVLQGVSNAQPVHQLESEHLLHQDHPTVGRQHWLNQEAIEGLTEVNSAIKSSHCPVL